MKQMQFDRWMKYEAKVEGDKNNTLVISQQQYEAVKKWKGYSAEDDTYKGHKLFPETS